MLSTSSHRLDDNRSASANGQQFSYDDYLMHRDLDPNGSGPFNDSSIHPLPKLMSTFSSMNRDTVVHAAQRRVLPYTITNYGPTLDPSHSFNLMDNNFFGFRKNGEKRLQVKPESPLSADGDSLSPASAHFNPRDNNQPYAADDTCFSWQDLSDQQIACICDSLLQSRNIEKLAKFLAGFPENSPAAQKETVLRAQAHLAFEQKNYKKLYEIMETKKFSADYHAELQKMWLEAHYDEAEKIKKRKLGAVDKYRLRRKFPLPPGIWDGK